MTSQTVTNLSQSHMIVSQVMVTKNYKKYYKLHLACISTTSRPIFTN